MLLNERYFKFTFFRQIHLFSRTVENRKTKVAREFYIQIEEDYRKGKEYEKILNKFNKQFAYICHEYRRYWLLYR